MSYLITTNLGNVYKYTDNKLSLVLKDETKSIYTQDKSIRFIKKYNDGYILGKSENLLFWCTNGGTFTLPGLVDIKDIIINDKYFIILSGLRDSVYILDTYLNNIVSCFNINKDGKIEFFTDRQIQCKEIPSTYFQIFYCPSMNNYHKFNKLFFFNDQLFLISEENFKSIYVSLKDFSIHAGDYSQPPILDYNLANLLDNEIITDYIPC